MKKKLYLMAYIIICSVLGVCVINNGVVNATCTTDSTTGVVTCTESASASVTVAEACTMTATNNIPHTAEIANGLYSGGMTEYTNGIGKTTLKVICNDASGFSIYAVGYTNNEFGNNKLMSDEQDATAPIINTGTADSGNTSAWAMKLSAVTGTYAPTLDNSFGSFHNVPNTYTRVAYRTSGTDAGSNPTGSSVEATYAAYVSPTQPAGTYVGRVKYTMIHPYTETPVQPQTTQSGQICYYPNANTYEGTMGCQTVSASATSATLLASNFSREGYGFAGWSTTFDYSTTGDNAHFYGPQEDITFTAGQYTGTNNGLSLYAYWVKSAGDLQNWTGCSSLASGAVTALTDQRDNETYAVAKLADGNCWMIENLRLADTHQEGANTVATTLTTINTNNPLNNGTNVTLKHNYSDTDTFTNLSSTSSVAYNADTAPDGWCTTNSAACYDQSRIRTDNTASRATGNPNTNSGSMYSYGNYYNWYSATAGRGTYSYSTNNSSVAGDLCPAGWRLPKGGSSTNATNSDFWQYGVAIMGNAPSNNSYYQSSETNTNGDTATKALRKYPNNYLYSGYVYGGSLGNRGTYGHYWSSTAISSNGAYGLDLDSSSVGPGTGRNNKYYGRTVRCLAQ